MQAPYVRQLQDGMVKTMKKPISQSGHVQGYPAVRLMTCLNPYAHAHAHVPSYVQAVSKGAKEYEQFYVPEMEARKKEKAEQEARRRKVCAST